MDEYLANIVVKAIGSDGNYPEFHQAHAQPDGTALAARMAGDNADNTYRVCGIYHGGSYRLRGRPRGSAKVPANTSFTLTGNYQTSVTVDVIESYQLEYEEDGSFIITIDDQPANGRKNHLTTGPRVKFLFVRDSMNDWSAEKPWILEVERTNAPTAEPLSDAEIIDLSVMHGVDEVPLGFLWHRLCAGKPVNTMTDPSSSRSLGGLITQATSLGWVSLGPDEAGVLTFDPADADYSSLGSYDWWHRSIDYSLHRSSIPDATAVRNADGTITCVISPTDPGVANWLDTGGLTNVLLVLRWQGLPEKSDRNPAISLEVVPLGELEKHLPPDTARMTPDERAADYQARFQQVRRRWEII